MQPSQMRSPIVSERRKSPRWLDKVLLTIQTQDDEYLGMTGDLSLTGMRIGLPRAPGNIGGRADVCLAFARELLVVESDLIYVRELSWGALIGVRYTRGQQSFRRFLMGRYYRAGQEEGIFPAKIYREYLDGLMNEALL